MVNIVEMLLTNHNRPKKKLIKLKALIIHWTANTNVKANAIANRNYFNTTKTSASAHYVIDDKQIVKCIPENEIGYHVGAKAYTKLGMTFTQGTLKADSIPFYSPNFFTCGIEMCVNSDGDWNKTYQNTVEFSAKFLKDNGLTIDSLYRHYDLTGKDCPKMMIDEAEWNKFKNEVNKLMNPEVQYPTIKVGSKGEHVKIVQNKLKELGYTITVDGDFGKGTDAVVKQFQKMYKLTQDGIVGRGTWEKILSAEKLPISIIEETKNYEIEYMNGYINIVKIPKDKLKKIDVILCKQPKETLSSVYNRLNPKPSFLLNGGLFAMNNGNSMSSMYDEGVKIVEGYFSDYGFYVKNDGSFGFGNHKQMTNIKDFIGASPSIIIDGKINIDLKGLTKDKAFTDSRHPRTCLGMDDKYLYLVVIDGRQKGKLGMTINELANFGMKLGLRYFCNLDGGGSSRLLGLNGKAINSPTENRAVDNCIAFYI
jgi:N-acetylmuramoyl-L-alanine amidase